MLVISSDKNTVQIENQKSVIILHYNSTKGGTDCFDWLCHSHTVNSRTNRWPFRVFQGMLDIAAVNARILLKCKYVNEGNKRKVTAKECLDKISMHLIKPFLERRLKEERLRSYSRIGIQTILEITAEPVENERSVFSRRKRCALCPRSKDNTTPMQCPSCQRAMCDKHRVYLCVDCGGTD